MPKPPKNKGKVNDARTKSRLPISASVDSGLDPLENFEIELLWCIQQVESSLSSKKMNPRAAEDAIKALSTLKNNKAPLIKKRQVMRTLFGDYRGKMADEEKKFYKANSNLKFIPSCAGEKSKFLKKSSYLSSKFHQVQSADMNEASGHDGGEKVSDKLVLPGTSKEETKDVTKGLPFSFRPSDNEFRFNFG